MSARQTAAAGIDVLNLQTQRIAKRNALHGEGVVQLDGLQLRGQQAIALKLRGSGCQHLGCGECGRAQWHARIAAKYRARDPVRSLLEMKAFAGPLRCEQDHSSAIGLGRNGERSQTGFASGVARSVRNHRHAGCSFRRDVARICVVVNACYRHYFGALRMHMQGLRTLVAQQCVRVLLCAAHALREGVVAGGLQQVGVLRRVGCERWALVGLRRFVLVQRARLANGRAAPGLHAAGDHHVGLARVDQAGRDADRIQTGTALAVDAEGRAARRQACGQRRHARRIAARAERVAEHDGIDVVGAEAGLREQGVHEWRGDLMGLQGVECAPLGHDGTARPGDDGGPVWRAWVAHRCHPFQGVTATPLWVLEASSDSAWRTAWASFE